MNDEAALLAAIIAEPEDRTARQVYADWLDENGRHARAAMIRAHVEAYEAFGEESVICGGSGFHMQAQGAADPLLQLMQGVAALTADPHANELNPFLQTLVTEGRLAWSRGFVEYVEVTFDEMMDHAAEIFSEHPVTRVDIVGREPYESDSGGYCWRRANDTEELYDGAWMLLGQLFDPLAGYEEDPAHPADPEIKSYHTRLDAMDALSNGTYFSVAPLAVLRFNSARGLVNQPQ
jgi:uncharacterized protein (TIGR02996 family)